MEGERGARHAAVAAAAGVVGVYDEVVEAGGNGDGNGAAASASASSTMGLSLSPAVEGEEEEGAEEAKQQQQAQQQQSSSKGRRKKRDDLPPPPPQASSKARARPPLPPSQYPPVAAAEGGVGQGGSTTTGGGGRASSVDASYYGAGREEQLQQQEHDEAVAAGVGAARVGGEELEELEELEEEVESASPSPPPPPESVGEEQGQPQEVVQEEEEAAAAAAQGGTHGQGKPPLEGAYDPREYLHLRVAPEIQELFGFITRYQPQEVEIETPLKCFIPDYLPAVGEMDAFLKMPRPDGLADELGLKVLDEPAPQQSDPSVLELELRGLSRRRAKEAPTVRAIERAAKNPQAVDKWVSNVQSLHRRLPPAQVHYRWPMPAVTDLLSPSERGSSQNDDTDLSSVLSLEEYAKHACASLGIPVPPGGLSGPENKPAASSSAAGDEGSMIEALHLLFLLYLELRDNHQPSQQQQQPSQQQQQQQQGPIHGHG